MNFKKIILIIVLVAILLVAGFAIFKSGKKDDETSNKMQIVASNFASYDFLRAIIGDDDNIELTYLLGPGKDSHSYDPTAGDLIKIQNADLFVYVGGEMESWVDKVLDSLDTNNQKVICIADDIETIVCSLVDQIAKIRSQLKIQRVLSAMDDLVLLQFCLAVLVGGGLVRVLRRACVAELFQGRTPFLWTGLLCRYPQRLWRQQRSVFGQDFFQDKR